VPRLFGCWRHWKLLKWICRLVPRKKKGCSIDFLFISCIGPRWKFIWIVQCPHAVLFWGSLSQSLLQLWHTAKDRNRTKEAYSP
jgi:hypothetical protein